MPADQLEFRPPLEIYCVPNLDPIMVATTFREVGDGLNAFNFPSEAYDPKTGRVVLDFSVKLTVTTYEEFIETLKARRSCVISVTKLLVRAQHAA